jgi:branched-chain amino acid transport system substrate-binding protein
MRRRSTLVRLAGRTAWARLGLVVILTLGVLASACQPQPQQPAKPAAPADKPAAAPAESKPAAQPAKPATEKPAASAQSIKVGIVHPLTGGVAFEGKQVHNGVLMRLEEANAAGGIKSLGGAKIEIMQADTQAKPEVGVAEAERMMRDGALAIMGAFQSAVTFPIAQAAERQKVPFVVSVAASDEITKRGFKYTFRQQPNTEQYASAGLPAIQDLIKRKGDNARSYVIMHEDTLFGTTMAGHVTRFAKDLGFKEVEKIGYKFTASDFTTEVSRVKSAAPDMLFLAGYYQDTLLILRAVRNLRIEFKAIIGIANAAMSNPKLVQDEPKLAEYMMDVNYWWNPRSDRAKQVREAFQRKYGEVMTNHAVQGYQSADVLIDALERAGKADRDALREALSKTKLGNLIVPGETIEFDEGGQNKNAQPLLLQIQQGVPRAISPEKYAETQPTYPIPKLDERLR